MMPVPSASMTNTSVVPARLLSKAMRVPSGDHAGAKSLSGPSVSLVRLAPSGSIKYTSARGSRALVKAMRVPSGDHRGPVSGAG